MKIRDLSIAVGLVLGSVGLAQACDAPQTPEAIDGSTATMDEMVAAQGAVKAFQAANAEYLTCVDEVMTAEKALVDEGDDDAKERYALAAADYNAAVSREEQVAGDFNGAVRAYKAANP